MSNTNDTLSGADVKERHLTPRLARALAHVAPSLTPAMVDVLSADSLPDRPLAADALGLHILAHAMEFHYALGGDAHIQASWFDRWGDPDNTGTHALHPFGMEATAYPTFSGLTIPSRIS